VRTLSFQCLGAGENLESRVGREFLYKDTVDYICQRGYNYNGTVTRRKLQCTLLPGSSHVAWNGTALNCTSEYLEKSRISPLYL